LPEKTAGSKELTPMNIRIQISIFARKGIFLFLFFLAAIPAKAGDWPMFLGNQQLSGNNDFVAPVAFDLAWQWNANAAIFRIVPTGSGILATLADRRVVFVSLSGRPVWERTLRSAVIRSPVIWRDYAFLVAGRELICLNLADGTIAWSITNNEVMLSAPLVSDGVVYAGSRGAFQARRAANGQLLWENRTIMTWGAAVVKVEDYLLIQHRDYRTLRSFLACLDAKSGKTLWLSEIAHDANIFPPLVFDDKVMQASANSLTVFSLESGQTLDTRNFPASFAGHPVNMLRHVYLSFTDGSIHAIASTNLQQTVASFANHRRQGNSFAANGGYLYLTGDDGLLYELDGRTGETVRSLALGGAAASHVQPILARGLVFLAMNTTLFCIGEPVKAAEPEIPKIETNARRLWLVDAATGRRLDGEVRLAWMDTNGRWNFSDGTLQNGSIVLAENVPAGVPLSVEKQGYAFARLLWATQSREERLALVPLAREDRWVLHDVFFLTGSALLQDASLPALYELARLLKANPQARVILEGHTDSSGSPAHNLILSRERAGAVMEFLVRQGIGAWRMESVGYGDTRPIADNSTPDGRMKNRRTEIRILL
jgi:outer membrane protein OmpA-like peptidoglycan-associated protein/outer membrane protein assembly factor BamB